MVARRRSDEPLVLYGNLFATSPYVLSSFVALREKTLPFEVRPVNLNRGEQHEAPFAKVSMTSRVPTLVDGEFVLSESSAIAEYLEEAYPPPGFAPILPTGIQSRARARQVMAWLRTDLESLRIERSSQYVFYPPDVLPPLSPLSPEALGAVDKLLEIAETLVPADAGPLFGAWCVADTELAMMLQRLVRTGLDLPSRIATYVARQWERPAVREFDLQPRPPFEPRPYPRRLPQPSGRR